MNVRVCLLPGYNCNFAAAYHAMKLCRCHILLILLLGSAQCCCAQLASVVFDMETRCCVPGVTVYVNPRGSTVTDRYGRFVINGECNSITLSHGSYEPLSLDNESVPDTVWLLPKMRRLDEVVIYGKKPKPGYDIRESVRRAVHGAGIKGSSGGNFDFFESISFKKRKQAKRRKKIKEMLDKY